MKKPGIVTFYGELPVEFPRRWKIDASADAPAYLRVENVYQRRGQYYEVVARRIAPDWALIKESFGDDD